MADVRSVPPIPSDFEQSNFQWSWFPRVERSVARTHTLLVSEHGIGKTYSLRLIAAKLGRPFWYVSAGFGLERSSLEGQYFPALTPAGTITLEPIDGIVASAVRGDGLLMISEFFRLPGDVQSCLFAAMDTHRGDYTITYRGETIRVGENFRVVADTNPPSPLYPEIEIADRALLSRFGAVLRLPFPDGAELARFMKRIIFPREHVVQTTHFMLKVKKAHDKGDIDNFVSPRDLMFFSQALKAGLSATDAFEDTIVGKFHDRYADAVRGLWKMNEGKTE